MAEGRCRYFLGFPIALKSDDAADMADEHSESKTPAYVAPPVAHHTSHITHLLH